MFMKGMMVEPSKGEGKQRNCNKEVLEICPISHFVTGTTFSKRQKITYLTQATPLQTQPGGGIYVYVFSL